MTNNVYLGITSDNGAQVLLLYSITTSNLSSVQLHENPISSIEVSSWEMFYF
jgi:hypothetical protein